MSSPSTRQALAQEVEEDSSPGSVYLVSGDGHLLSLPIPSDSPDDPLSWSVLRRCCIVSLIIASAAVGIAVQQFPTLIYNAVLKEFGDAKFGPFNMGHTGSVPTLFMGIGCLIWTPLSLWLGRRPSLIMATGLAPIATLLCGVSTTFGAYIVALSLLGIANGVAFGMALLVLIDVTFIHQRSNAIAANWALATSITQLMICIVPLTSDLSTEWRPVYKAWAVPSAVLFVLVWLYVPETYFLRPPVALDGRILVQSGSEKIRVYDHWDQVPGGRPSQVSSSTTTAAHGISAAPGPAAAAHDDSFDRSSTAELGGGAREAVRLALARSHSTADSSAAALGRGAGPPRAPGGRGWASRHLAVRKAAGGSWRSAAAFFPQVGLCLANPLLFWVALLNAVNFSGMVSIGITYPAVLLAPPYALGPRAVALVNLAAAAGALLAWPGSGLVIERVTNRLTRRNGGVRHAEYYLPGFALPVATGALSLALYGLAVRHGWHPACIYAAYGLNCFSYVSGAVANTVWAAAVFPRWAAAALAVVGGVSYMISFGLSYAIQPWIKSQGFAGANLQIAAIILVLGLVAVPIAFWGRNVRQFIHSRWGAYEAGAVRPQ